jgi:hypothetical protein
LGNFPWKYLIIDEGHRIKNFQCKLIKWVIDFINVFLHDVTWAASVPCNSRSLRHRDRPSWGYIMHSNLFVQSQASNRTMWPSNNRLYRIRQRSESYIGSCPTDPKLWWIMPAFDPSNMTFVLLWLRCGFHSWSF